MSNVLAFTLRADAIRRAADGYDEAWNSYFRSVFAAFDRQTAMRMADSHVEHMQRRDAKILAAVAIALGEPEHA